MFLGARLRPNAFETHSQNHVNLRVDCSDGHAVAGDEGEEPGVKVTSAACNSSRLAQTQSGDEWARL